MMMIFRTDASSRGFMMHLIDHIYFADLHPPAVKSLSYLQCETTILESSERSESHSLDGIHQTMISHSPVRL